MPTFLLLFAVRLTSFASVTKWSVRANTHGELFKVISNSFLTIYFKHYNSLVENENHCDFVKLREMLIRTNKEDLRETTHVRHYEIYRRFRLEQVNLSFNIS